MAGPTSRRWPRKSRSRCYAKDGTTLSTDATLTNLALEDFNGDPITLNETFASTLLTYTASVTNADTQIDVLPTRSDANATIEYLDGDGVALPDADPDLNNFQVDLDPGDNVIQVKVTAEDTTTMKTYMVTVTREGTTDTLVTIEAEYVEHRRGAGGPPLHADARGRHDGRAGGDGDHHPGPALAEQSRTSSTT